MMVTTRYSNQQGSKLRDKTLARFDHPTIPENYRRHEDVFGHELQLLLSGVLSVIQNLNYKLQRKPV